MCGISGIVGACNSARNKIQLMVEAQVHRGPDQSGFYEDSDENIFLGHNRLSIIDLSDNASQPMVDISGNYVVVFNGEIYNHLEVRKELYDYPFKSRSDTEVLLAAYIKWGESFLSHLVGMFAFAIWDKKHKTLFCARDRFGEKPFYWILESGVFYFASEIKALKAAGINLEINPDTMSVYLSKGLFESGEKTFFNNIYSLPPGHFLIYKKGKVPKLNKYWDLADYKVRKEESEICYQEKLGNSLKRSVKLQLNADVPVVLNLSSGIDSQILLKIIQDYSPHRTLNTFTFGFSGHKTGDASLISDSDHINNVNKYIFFLTPDEILDELSTIYFYQEGPIGGLSTLAYSRLHKKIKELGFKVAIEGQGADEIFAGYSYYQKNSTYDDVYQDGSSYLSSNCISNDAHKLATSILKAKTSHSKTLSLVEKQIIDIKCKKLPRVLRMNDRLSMASGIELREPYLDHRIAEDCISAPDYMKLADGLGKGLLRNFNKNYFEKFATQPKLAIGTPQAKWVKTHLKEYIMDSIYSNIFRESGYFNFIEAKKAFQKLINSDINTENTFFVWQWINYIELIKQVINKKHS
jgi:asparagine synthase (glutamine-hydrolysing)